MATYKESVGTGVVNFAGNNPGVVEGQLWYDSTNLDFKYQYPALSSASWSTQSSLNTGRFQGGGAGSITSALVFGGEYSGSPSQSANTESFNGGAWSEVADLNTARNKRIRYFIFC